MEIVLTCEPPEKVSRDPQRCADCTWEPSKHGVQDLARLLLTPVQGDAVTAVFEETPGEALQHWPRPGW